MLYAVGCDVGGLLENMVLGMTGKCKRAADGGAAGIGGARSGRASRRNPRRARCPPLLAGKAGSRPTPCMGLVQSQGRASEEYAGGERLGRDARQVAGNDYAYVRYARSEDDGEEYAASAAPRKGGLWSLGRWRGLG